MSEGYEVTNWATGATGFHQIQPECREWADWRGRNPASKHQIQPECGEWAGWRGTGRPNPSREAKFSGANRDREIFIFPVQLTTSRIDNLGRLIHTHVLHNMQVMRHYLQGMVPINVKTVHKSSLSTPYCEQPRPTRIVVASPRSYCVSNNNNNTLLYKLLHTIEYYYNYCRIARSLVIIVLFS